MLSDDIIISTIRTCLLDKSAEGCQRVVSLEMHEGSSREYKRRVVISDIYAVAAVDALLKEREETQNRIAELGDQIRSNAEAAGGARCPAPRGSSKGGFAPEPAIPAQDSGAALVGVECWVWGGEYGSKPVIADPIKILHLSDSGATYEHARPVALGRPE